MNGFVDTEAKDFRILNFDSYLYIYSILNKMH